MSQAHSLAIPNPSTIQIVLGKDATRALEEVPHPEARDLLTRAIQIELRPVCPGRQVEVSFDPDRASCVQGEGVTHADLERVVDRVQAVLGNPHRYEWDGAELATPAQAITYVLNRCQNDADLGYLVGPGTESFRLLCEAEAGLLKLPLATVMDRRGKNLAREPRQYFRAGERHAPVGDNLDGEEG